MALPPIISNLPIIKLFTKPQEAANTVKAEQAPPPKARDSVSLSVTAQKLASAPAIKDQAQAYLTAAETRNLLQGSGLSLGLDPGFN